MFIGEEVRVVGERTIGEEFYGCVAIIEDNGIAGRDPCMSKVYRITTALLLYNTSCIRILLEYGRWGRCERAIQKLSKLHSLCTSTQNLLSYSTEHLESRGCNGQNPNRLRDRNQKHTAIRSRPPSDN
jgi:hypothetical protein